jgi:hypothetical protein
MHGSANAGFISITFLGCQLRAGRGDSLIMGRLCVSLQMVSSHRVALRPKHANAVGRKLHYFANKVSIMLQ